ncbi:LytR/AlgR family response regulator transcription factor [Aquimarina hainanensis]|uniref:LytR/AlgR family response regulator transcription factor n=1 Tax=Aquimarina hainanensis TaxID=1578017 RepID=A0ABW5N3W8_9FLAO
MIRCVIIEDQPPAQRILKKYILGVDDLLLMETFSDVIKAKEYMQTTTIDLLFLDVHLPKISGIDFLKSFPNHPKVILTTAFSEYALESYAFNVVDYLLKPIPYERFLQAIAKLRTSIVSQAEKAATTVIIKSGYEHIKVYTDAIIYIKSDSDYTEVNTVEKKYLSKDSLKQWLEKLNENDFCQVHKSYLINVQYLSKVVGNTIYLADNNIPIGRAFKKHFVSRYLQ